MITSATVFFSWLPAGDGYEWVSVYPVSDDWLVEKRKTLVLIPKGFPMGWAHYGKEGGAYEPLKRASGLFRELAEVEPVPDAIMAFADQYGPLTRGQLFIPIDSKEKWAKPPASCKLAYIRLRPESEEGREASSWEGEWQMRGAISGDSFAYWQENIRALNSLVNLWEAILKRSVHGIEKYAQFEKRGKQYSISLEDEAGPLDDPMTFVPGEVVTLQVAAEYALIRAIAHRIYYTTSVDFYPPSNIGGGKLAIVPHSLRDAIWLQFGLAVIENKKFRSCDVCGKPFEVSPQVARTNRTLCSPACKARAHRHRREQALKLADEGVKPKEIASRVGSQLTTVRKWLSERKK